MKTLHVYLARQVLQTLVMTISVFTFVLLIASALKDVLGMLVGRQAPLAMLAQAVGYLIPYVMVFALPMAMLTATLLVFGRFSADQELTAARAGGISLVALVTPVLLLGVAMSGVSAIINLHLAPRCRTAYNTLLRSTVASTVGALLPEKTYIKDFSDSIVYVSEVRGTNLEDILIFTLDGARVESYVRAERGTIRSEASGNIITVWLTNFHRVYFTGNQQPPQAYQSQDIEFSYTNTSRRASLRVSISDRTFLELQDELRDLEERIGAPIAAGRAGTEEMRRKLRAFLAQRKADLTAPVRVRMHRQLSLSFACIGFTLVGIPLGIRAHRRETTFGIALALILVALYYSFFIVGEALATRPELSPHLIVWLPNFIFQAVGIVLLWRANRGM